MNGNEPAMTSSKWMNPSRAEYVNFWCHSFVRLWGAPKSRAKNSTTRGGWWWKIDKWMSAHLRTSPAIKAIHSTPPPSPTVTFLPLICNCQKMKRSFLFTHTHTSWNQCVCVCVCDTRALIELCGCGDVNGRSLSVNNSIRGAWSFFEGF